MQPRARRTSFALPAYSYRERGRRHARASHASAARCTHYSGPQRHARKPARRNNRRYRSQPCRPLQYFLLSKFGVEVCCADPRRCCRAKWRAIAPGVELTTDMEIAIRDVDVIMMLRVQLERQHEAAFPGQRIFSLLRLAARACGARQTRRDRHASGPINRGQEISSEVADSQRSAILNQVENGVAVRMAVLERVLAG